MKKRRSSQVLSCIIALILILSMVPVVNVSAVTTNIAEVAGTTTSGLKYEISGGEVTITDYTGSATTCTIPSQIEGYPVTSIGVSAFNYCTSLTSVTIPSSVTSIGYNAFANCASLTSITIPSSVTSIGEHAFYYCTSLTSITIPSSVTSIGNNAFSGCESLTSITIPEGVTSIGEDVFSDCRSLTSITIPSSVTSIGDYAFYDCTSLTSITIPSSVTSIGDWAFASCDSLTSVAISEGVTSIGDWAFYYCTSLASITIPSGVTVIGERAFSDCNSLTSITIPSSVASIGDRAFQSCDSLTSITIPSSVTSIGEYAFCDCTSLTSITIPEGVTSIGEYAFSECTSLKSITIPSSVTSIGEYAFSECTSLTNITIPKGVTSIGNGAFSDCTSLRSITIPSSVTSIGKYAFSSCTDHTSITVDEDNSVYDSRNDCNAIIETDTNTIIAGFANTVIPSSVTSIGEWAFLDCTSLTSITIPSSVTSIGKYAFLDCTSLTSITIPSSVTSIENSAFYLCRMLNDVYYSGTQAQWNAIEIGDDNEDLLDAEIHYNYVESTKPTVSVSSTNLVASSQTVTLSMSDNVGVVSYYWGTSSSPSSSSFTTISSTTSTSIQKTVSSSGTYYLIAKDAAGNVSSTASITYYQTTLNANGGSVSPTSVLTKSGNSFTLPTLTRFAYKFKGWSTASTATSGSTTITPTSNTTYYAVWQAPTTLSVNSTNTASISSGGEMKYYSYTPSTSGKHVIYSTADVDTKVYLYDSDGIELDSDDDGGDSTNFRLEYNLTAGEKYYFGVRYYNSSNTGSIPFTFGRVYTITYNANGGSGAPSTQYKDYGTSITLSTEKPTKSNYTFAGWATSSTATSASYQPGDTYSAESNRTLYAVWTPADTTQPTVSVSSTNLVASSQTVTLSMSDNVGVVSYYWGTSSSPSSSAYTTITSTKSTSIQKTVSSNGTYYLIAKDAAGNVSSTASITYYKTTLNANGGSVSPTSVLTKSSNSFTPPAPARFGYNFKGWSTSSTATSGSTTITPNSNTTYYAIWQSAYILSDGSTNTADVSVGGEMRYYSFTPSTSGKYVIYSTGSGDPMVTLYNSSGNMLSSDDEDGESNNFRLEYNLTSGTKYYFGVEFYSSSTTGSIPFKFGRVYNITYNANGGSGAPSTQYKDYGTSITLSTEKPTRSNYTFAGWATSSTASSATYQPGDIYSSNSNVTLYAVWKAVADTTKPTVSISTTNLSASSQTATLSLSDNVGVVSYYWGTSSSPSSSSFTTISSTTSTSVQKTVSSSGTYYLIAKDAAGNVSSTASITYYKTTLNANGGSVSPTSVLTKSGNSVTLPTPTRSGYSFVGWGTSSTSTSGVTYITANANKTYYAVWDYIDTTKPTVSVSSTNLVSASQTASLSLSDNVGVVSYYWGTSSSPSSSSYTTITSTKSTSIQKTVSSSGTYYLIAKDADGNVSTAATITFYKTTLNANGGSVSPTSVLTKSGETVILPTPTRTNYGFAGWGTTSTATSGINALTVYENRTYYAIWSDKDTKNPTVSVRSTNNLDSSQTATLVMSDNIGVVSYYWGKSASPSSSAFISIASATSKSVDVRVYESGTYYLIAKDAEGNSSITAATFYTTTLNANGGTVSPSSILTKSGNTVTLPTPVRNSYKYLGWNVLSTATSGSLSVSVTSNRTYYAVWEYIHTCSFTGEEEIVVDATCTENGSKLVHCTEPSCSKVQTVVIEAYGHSEGEWEVVKPVACLENGLKERRCPDCDHLFESEIIYSTGHSMGEWYVYRKPGFYTQGEERKDCANCDYFDYKFIPETSIGHQCDFTGEEEIVFAATCTESGSKKIYCFEPECGEYILETIESFGHSLGDWQIYKEAKFHEEGEERKTCEHCAYFENRPIPKTSIGHKCKFTGKEEFIVKATCLDDGSKKVFCFEPECGEYKEVEVKRTGHNISDWTVYTEVQFHIDGEERKTCANCGFYESRVIPKLSESHTCSFTGRVNVVFEPTCTETGLKKTYCIEPECGKYLTETPEALGHTESEFMVLKDATCTEDGTKQQKCTVCDEILKTEVITAYGHEYNDWTVSKEATDTEAGEKTRECFICHYVESEIVDPLVPPTTTPDEEKTDLGLLGDVNGDGKVNIKDATTIQKATAKITALSDDEKLRADVNADTKNNVKDATAIQKFVAKIETGYPIGEKIK
ncbi:MAG: hypothetical protein E7563_01680 [Ruminococcaceae bacterium]|nr:hypothetical protein [Oscillospiraceae bacterium]